MEKAISDLRNSITKMTENIRVISINYINYRGGITDIDVHVKDKRELDKIHAPEVIQSWESESFPNVIGEAYKIVDGVKFFCLLRKDALSAKDVEDIKRCTSIPF